MNPPDLATPLWLVLLLAALSWAALGIQECRRARRTDNEDRRPNRESDDARDHADGQEQALGRGVEQHVEDRVVTGGAAEHPVRLAGRAQ